MITSAVAEVANAAKMILRHFATNTGRKGVCTDVMVITIMEQNLRRLSIQQTIVTMSH
jgi:hypothetical protein